MNSQDDPNLVRLLKLYHECSEGESNTLNNNRIYKEALACLNRFSFLYFEGETLLCFDLICRLTRISDEAVVDLMEKLDSRLWSVKCMKRRLFYLDLLIQVTTRGVISFRLSDKTNNHIKSILQKDPEGVIIQTLPQKRNRTEEPVAETDLDSKLLGLIEYLICLPLSILKTRSQRYIQKYCSNLNTLHTILQEHTEAEPGLKRKFYVKYISCMNLIWSRYPKEAKKGLLDSSVLLPIVRSIPSYFDDQEALDSWMELLYRSEKIRKSDRNYRYLPDNLKDTVLTGTDQIKKTFLKLFEHYNIQNFKEFLEYSLSKNPSDMKFIGEVCLVGVRRFHCLTNEEFTDSIATFPTLFDIHRFKILPDYCFELLILYYKRALTINAMDSFAETVNNRLHKEMNKMTLESMCIIGDYLGLVLDKPKINTLAKKWIDKVVEPQVLDRELNMDRLYCLFTLLFPVGYLPEDQRRKRNSDRGLEEIKNKLRNLLDYANSCANNAYEAFVSAISRIAKSACSKGSLILSISDTNFLDCKELFTHFSDLLLQTQSKFHSVSQITFNITKTKLSTMSKYALVQEYQQFKLNFSIDTVLDIESILNSLTNKRIKASRTVDIKTPFKPESVLTFLRTTLICEGVKRLLRYVTTYYVSKTKDEKSSIIGKLSDWSANLISIARSDLFRYLSSNLNEAGKAYIIQQIFLCATHQTKSFLKLMSSAIKFYYLEPTKAIEYDTSLLYILNSKIIQDIAKLVNSNLTKSPLEVIPNRLFYGPLDSKTDGETIYGGYIILNNRHKDRDPLSQASAKVALVHELGYLIMRFEGSLYDFMKTSPKHRIRIQLPGGGIKYSTEHHSEIGEFIETKVFGFTVKYINTATIEFLNNNHSWMKNLKVFKEMFTSCIQNMSQEKVPLKRFKFQERSPISRRNCVYRHLGYFSEEE